MKKCLNCNWDVRETDTYCRNCGLPLQSNKNYIITNIIIVIIVICMVCLLALFIASYLVNK